MFQHVAFQQKEGLCGPASLKIALHYFGIEKSEKQITAICGSTSAGIEAEGMQKAVKKFGLKSFVKENSEIDDIRKNLRKKRVVLVDWFLEDDGHWSVVSKIDKENIYLQDPHLGHLRAIRLDIFKRIWFTFPGKYMKTKNDLGLRKMLVVYR